MSMQNTADLTIAGHNPVLLESHLKTLRLPMIAKEYAKAAREAGERGVSHESYLERLTELEVQSRQSGATMRRLKQANFPAVKELSEFDFSAVPALNKKKVLDLFKCQFVRDKSSVIWIGAPGVGKSHLAIALGREAARQGLGVKFFTASQLVNTYVEAKEQRQVMKLESNIRKMDLIIIDELGYLPLDLHAAEHLFGFFSQCYEQVSVAVTTNLPFADWPSIFAGDARLAGALIDRLTHRVHVMEIPGESYRLKQSLKSKEGDATTAKTTKPDMKSEK